MDWLWITPAMILLANYRGRMRDSLLDTTTRAIGLAGLTVLLTLVGCSAVPDTSPSPTPSRVGFTSEDEAFAAAEATYRAYSDAVNVSMNGGEREPLDQFLTGSALSEAVKAEDEVRESAIRLVGEGRVDTFRGLAVDLEAKPQRITAEICVDASGTRLLNAEGADITPADRQNRSAVEITFIGGTAEDLRVSKSIFLRGQAC